MDISNIKYNHGCFVCGENNPFGLKLKFFLDGEKVYTEYIPTETYQGWPGILHGGITSTILDEVMSQCVQTLGYNGLTARLEVRYRNSIPVNSKVRFEAWITRRKGPLFEIEGRAVLEDGKTAAEAKSRFMITADHQLP